MREICKYCITRKLECKDCIRIKMRYPSKYEGRRFRSMKELEEVTR